MKLGMLQTDQDRRPVAVTEASRFVDLRAVDHTLPVTIREILADENGLARAARAAKDGDAAGKHVEGRLLAPVPDAGKVLCIGLNYRDHAAESNMDVPSEPICFGKFGSALCGPGDEVMLPAIALKVDYEAELVAVIGRRGRNISEQDARGYVAGYMNGNDISARDWQMNRPGGQWLLGKTPDGFAPTGPYLVTADEIADPQQLGIRFRRNGELLQDGTTADMIFGIDQVIAFVSRLMTLEPGDLIFTGTPAGVGFARDPKIFLEDGDQVEVEIDGLGVLSNSIRRHPNPR